MENVLDNSPTKNPSISRRDFLKLLGGAAVLVGGGRTLSRGVQYLNQANREIQAGINCETDPYSKIDFVNHPEWLVANPDFVGRMKRDMIDLSHVTDGFLQRESVFEGLEKMSVNLEAWQGNAMMLVGNVARWGVNAVQVKQQGLSQVGYEVDNKFREQGSYLRSILMFYEAHKNDPTEKFDELLRHFLYGENMGNVITQQDRIGQKPMEGLARVDIPTIWSYDWHALTQGEIAWNPIVNHLFDTQGNSLQQIPDKGADLYFPIKHPVIDKDPLIFGLHPEKTKILHFDPQVQQEVVALLRRYGIERSSRDISWFPAEIPMGFTIPEGNINIGGPEELSIEKYHKYKAIYDHNILHEASHALSYRSTVLNDADRMRFRDLQLGIAKRFDPLATMENIFAPDGAYPNMSEYPEFIDFINAEANNGNYMTLTDYYFQHLDGLNNTESVNSYRDELRKGFVNLIGVDIFQYFSPQGGDRDLESLFGRLQKSLPEMDSFSKYFTNVLLDHKEAILKKKRYSFEDAWQTYFLDQVVPYTLTHIGLYRQEELMKHLPEGKNVKLVKHFIQSWQKRLDRFVRGQPTEELTADIFAYSALDKDGKINWGDTRRDFDTMLAILKRNKLAFQPPQDVV